IWTHLNVSVKRGRCIVIADERTRQLPGLDPAVVSREQFNTYLRKCNLTILDVAVAAGLRLIYVWKVSRGEPVEVQHAGAIRKALYALTREPYTGLIAVLFKPVISASPTPLIHGEAYQQEREYVMDREKDKGSINGRYSL
ncbi:MAG: hypothetical protein ABI406_00765, partial [Ktedonobacteraceae bacterium]